MGQEHLIRISKGSTFRKAAQPNHCSTSWTFSLPISSSSSPFFPFSLLPFLNWLWNWSIFLNYLLYLLNKVFNVPVFKFRLSLPFTYLPFQLHPPTPKILHLLSCFNWSAEFGYHISVLPVVSSSKSAFIFEREIKQLSAQVSNSAWLWLLLRICQQMAAKSQVCFLSTLLWSFLAPLMTSRKCVLWYIYL